MPPCQVCIMTWKCMESNGGTSSRKFTVGITRFTPNQRPRLPITQKTTWAPQSIWTTEKSVKSLFAFSNRNRSLGTLFKILTVKAPECYGVFPRFNLLLGRISTILIFCLQGPEVSPPFQEICEHKTLARSINFLGPLTHCDWWSQRTVETKRNEWWRMTSPADKKYWTSNSFQCSGQYEEHTAIRIDTSVFKARYDYWRILCLMNHTISRNKREQAKRGSAASLYTLVRENF